MKAIDSYRDLEVWQLALDLAVKAYRLVRTFPRMEQFAIGNQLISSSISIAANIAEGYGRYTRAEYLRFLTIANGSRCEFETRLAMCARAGLVAQDSCEAFRSHCQRVGQMLTRLRQRLRQTRS